MEKVVKDLISDILSYKALNQGMLTVAEVCSHNANGVTSNRDINTILLSKNHVRLIKPSHINVPVKTKNTRSGNSKFYLYLSDQKGLNEVDPLAISWSQNNHITLQPSILYLEFYRLTSRIDSSKIYWDDLSRPFKTVVENSPKAHYQYPSYDVHGYVRMHRDYLEDYAVKRNKVVVQIFQEIRWVHVSKDLEPLLSEGYYIFENENLEVRLSRHDSEKDQARLEVNGYRVLIDPKKLRKKKSDSIGDIWPGIDQGVNYYGMHFKPDIQYVYVLDEVLKKYEDRDDIFEVDIEYGSVHYGNQWAVTHCKREGRNAIQVDLKKLYEGTPYEEIQHWKSFAILKGEVDYTDTSIAEKSQRLIMKYMLFARVLSELLNRIMPFDIYPESLVSFEQSSLDNYTIYDLEVVKPVTHHVNYNHFSRYDFLIRCKNLAKVINEGFDGGRKILRKTIKSLNLQEIAKSEWGSLKMLDLILNYLKVSHDEFLHPIDDNETIVQILSEKGLIQLIPVVFALNDLRQLDAHRKNNSDELFKSNLDRFDIHVNSIGNNYSKAINVVYDKLIDTFIDLNMGIIHWYNFK